MTDKKFNEALKRAFQKYSSDEDLINWAHRTWLKNNLTIEQENALEELKEDASRGDAASAERYFIL